MKLFQVPAPSSEAASYSSLGIVVVAAYRLIATNGMDIQTISRVTTEKVENWVPIQL